MTAEDRDQIVILIPAFNDWESLAKLIPSLDAIFRDTHWQPRLLVVNDDSTTDVSLDRDNRPKHLIGVDVLDLRRNVGHQRAIAVGLVYVHLHIPCEAVVIMDGDGEDRPEDVIHLLAAYRDTGRRKVVFAARVKRLEGVVFQLFYHAYRLLHFVLTGIAVRVGNFSVVPSSAVARLVVTSELWNHFAATVFRSRIPYETVPTVRGRRLAGRSQMNFFSLLVHGLSAISVFSDVVGARLLAVSAVLIVVTIVMIVTTISLRFASDLAIPGWATYATGLLLILLAQTFTISFMLAFSVISGRAGSGFIPLRDAPLFVRCLERWFPRP